jgi:hypothetical protein
MSKITTLLYWLGKLTALCWLTLHQENYRGNASVLEKLFKSLLAIGLLFFFSLASGVYSTRHVYRKALILRFLGLRLLRFSAK